MTLGLTEFWIKYAGGKLRRFSDFKRELVALRLSRDPPSPGVDMAFEDPRIPPPAPGLDRLRLPSHFTSTRYVANFDRADWSGVDPRLTAWAGRFQLYLRKLEIPVFVFSAARGEAEQNSYVARGTSNARFPNSAHNRGGAVDIIHSRFGWNLSKSEWQDLYYIGSSCLRSFNNTLPADDRLSLEWGGHWSKPFDPAHWQIANWRSMSVLPPTTTPLRLSPSRASKLL